MASCGSTCGAKSEKVCVLGAGVIGLATAQELRRRGHAVVILAECHPCDDRNASPGAGGFWEPFKVHRSAPTCFISPGTARAHA